MDEITLRKFRPLWTYTLLWAVLFFLYNSVNFMPPILVKESIKLWNDPLHNVNYKILSIGMNTITLIFFASIAVSIPLAWLSFALKKYTRAYRIITFPFAPLIIITSCLVLGLAYYAGGPDFMQF